MITDPVLVNDWHPVVAGEELAARRVVGARLLGEDIVVWYVSPEKAAALK